MKPFAPNRVDLRGKTWQKRQLQFALPTKESTFVMKQAECKKCLNKIQHSLGMVDTLFQ